MTAAWAPSGTSLTSADLGAVMTPEIWTILGTGAALASLGIAGFTLLWRYITRAEERSEARFAELKSDLATAEKRSEARFAELVTEQKALGTRLHTLEIQMAKLEGLLEGLREAITGKRAAA